MRGVQGAADRAVSLAREQLLSQSPGSRLHDVSKDPRFQHRGIDLLWERDGEPVLGVEVKGDRQGGRRGNYFFELVSNVEKDTPGCFLYSEADLLLYVFVVDTLGFHITAGALLLAWSRLLGASWRLALPVSLAATVVIHLAFYKLLKVPLPWGLLERVVF